MQSNMCKVMYNVKHARTVRPCTLVLHPKSPGSHDLADYPSGAVAPLFPTHMASRCRGAVSGWRRLCAVITCGQPDAHAGNKTSQACRVPVCHLQLRWTDTHRLILCCSDVVLSACALVDIISLVYFKIFCAMPLSHAYSWPST